MDTNLNSKRQTFKEYFHTIINNRVENFLRELNINHKTFLFSGILRNFFLNVFETPRDLDIILSKTSMSSDLIYLMKKYGDYKMNSYGGYKLEINNLKLDIWFIEDTWALNYGLVDVSKFNSIEDAVLHSTFFNFSSILYDFKKEKFIYDNIFSKFLQNKTIDIVLNQNPSEILCVVNIIYYAEKYKLSLSNKTKNYFLDKFPVYYPDEYDRIQIKHFGKIIYSYQSLEKFGNNL